MSRMDTNTPAEALKSAIAMFSSLKAFSDALGVRYQVVQQWIENRVPAEYCPKIERVTGRKVRCEQLRSDVDWGYVRQSQSHSEEAAV